MSCPSLLVFVLEPHRGLDPHSIVLDEIEALHAGDDTISLDGPAVRLTLKAAELIALAIHELAVNAATFGELETPGGRVSLNWQIVQDRQSAKLVITWREYNLHSPPAPAEKNGFGFEILRHTLPYELDAETDISFVADGLAVRFELPCHVYSTDPDAPNGIP